MFWILVGDETCRTADKLFKNTFSVPFHRTATITKHTSPDFSFHLVMYIFKVIYFYFFKARIIKPGHLLIPVT